MISSCQVVGTLITSLSSGKGQHFVLNTTDTQDTDLPSLHAMLLPKQPSMGLQNALPLVMAFHTAVLLIREITS